MIVVARRRAGLSQRELALRLGKRQTEITRWERGHVVPSLERLREVVAACGLELTFGLANADDSYNHHIAEAHALPVAKRLARGVLSADRVRRARATAKERSEPAPLDVLGVLRALHVANVAHVLVGEIAEVLHGTPLIPSGGVLTIVPRAGERTHLYEALAATEARSLSEPSAVAIDTAERWQLAAHGLELLVTPAPAGSQGYEDLRRDATVIKLVKDLDVPVASLIDLVRLAEASPSDHDRARVPALRRTLELAPTSAAPDRAGD